MTEIKIDNISLIPENWPRYIIAMDTRVYFLDVGPGTKDDDRILFELYKECPTLFMWEE